MNHEQVKAVRIETKQRYTSRDTILYALGVGVGAANPTDRTELSYTYESGLRALPTMAVVLAYPGFWLAEPKYEIKWERLLHGEQSTVLHKPLPVEADIVGVTTVDDIYDKGVEKGALVYSTRNIYEQKSGDHLASVSTVAFLRGDGGCGGKSEGAPKPHSLPSDRKADQVIEIITRPEQALIYRLSGDFNPLHVDPEVATRGGFAKPILHGLCTYGVAGRAVLAGLCKGNPSALKRFDVRFSSPVYPGETLVVEIWRESAGRAALQARVKERDVVVLQNGYAEFLEDCGT